MLPTKWKIFRIANYLHIAGAGSLMLFLFFDMYRHPSKLKADPVLFLYIICIGLMLLNGFINLHLVEKCYPNKHPGKTLRTTTAFVAVLNIIILLLLLISSFYTLYKLLFTDNAFHIDFTIFTVVIVTTSFTGIYVWWQQIILEKLIKRNYNNQLNSFLEEIPTP